MITQEISSKFSTEIIQFNHVKNKLCENNEFRFRYDKLNKDITLQFM